MRRRRRAWRTSWSTPSPTGATPRRRAARTILAKLEADLAPSGAKIATVIGRYFAMDRDKRWERNKLAWDAIVLGRGEMQHGRAVRGHRRPPTRSEPRGDEFLQPMIFCHAERAARARRRCGPLVQLPRRPRAPAFRGVPGSGVRRLRARGHAARSATTRSPNTTRPTTRSGCRVIFAPESMEQHPRRSRRRGRPASSCAPPRRRNIRTSPSSSTAASRRRSRARTATSPISPKEVPTYDMKPQMSAPDLAFEVVRRLRELRSRHPELRQPRHGRPHRRRRGRHPCGGDHRPRACGWSWRRRSRSAASSSSPPTTATAN